MNDGKLYRITFSFSVADRIAREHNYSVQRITLVLGKPLKPGERSSTGLYAIVGHKGNILRVPMSYEAAEILCDWKWRHLTECFLLL